MKVVSVLLLLVGVMVAFGCGGDGSDNGDKTPSGTNGGGGASSLDCDKFCQKAVACGQKVGTEAECVDYCTSTKKILTAECEDKSSACLDKACNEFEACFSQVTANGPTDVSTLADAICAKAEECSNGQLSKDVCLAQMNATLAQAKCFTKEAVDNMASCAETTSCEDFANGYRACVKDKLGVDIGS